MRSDNSGAKESVMLKTIVLASKNRGKIEEIKNILGDLPIEIISLDKYPDTPEVVEDGDSFLANTLKKAKVLSDYTGMPVLADDSGLQVDYLKGAPGIHSARFAGAGAADGDNNEKLLRLLKGVPPAQRGASFCCVLVLYWPNGEYEEFSGCWPGRIGDELRGANGFGYDPLFFLNETGLSVAELTPAEKNQISHRAQAVRKLKKYLQSRFFS